MKIVLLNLALAIYMFILRFAKHAQQGTHRVGARHAECNIIRHRRHIHGKLFDVGYFFHMRQISKNSKEIPCLLSLSTSKKSKQWNRIPVFVIKNLENHSLESTYIFLLDEMIHTQHWWYFIYLFFFLYLCHFL